MIWRWRMQPIIWITFNLILNEVMSSRFNKNVIETRKNKHSFYLHQFNIIPYLGIWIWRIVSTIIFLRNYLSNHHYFQLIMFVCDIEKSKAHSLFLFYIWRNISSIEMRSTFRWPEEDMMLSLVPDKMNYKTYNLN